MADGGHRGTTRTFLESAAPRVQCPDHGVLVAHVPWARPGAKCTYLLEDTCAWLAKNMALTAVTVFLRLSWRTVAAIVARVVQDLTGKTDQLDGLTRIGIDEISYRKGHRYLTCVVDHDTGRLVWAHEGRNKDTLTLFFDALGPTRSALLTHVSADGAEWIHAVVRDKAPKAAICLDPFHVVMWATKALDKVRRRTLEHAGDRDRNARWAVVKNPDDLTADQRQSLATIRTTKHRPVPRLPAQGTTPRGLRQQRPPRRTTPRRLDRLGTPLPTPRVRRAGPHDQTVPAADLEHPPQTWCVERAIRSHQHPHPSPDQTRLRLPLTRSPHRHGHAHPRRTQTRTPRPESLNRNGFPTTRGAPAPLAPERSFRPSEVGNAADPRGVGGQRAAHR